MAKRGSVENTILYDRAYSAMYGADQKFGHYSVPHRVAWTVFSELGDIIAGNSHPRAFSDNAERRLALELVEHAVKTKGKRISPALEEMASRKRVI